MASPDELTVVVFKDNLSSRSFHIPLRWFSWLGLALGLSLGCTALASALAWRYFRAARAGDPGRVQDMEATLGQLRLSNQELESRLAQAQVAYTPPAPAQVAVPTPAATAAGAVLALPFTTDTGPLPDSTRLPIEVDPARFTWKGGQLNVRFPILYRATDGGSQQGRIVLLVRGPSALLAYPEGVLAGQDSPALIEPDRGEYFSVSRYREVTAEFGPIPNRKAVSTMDILIFSTSGKLLLRRGARVAEDRPTVPRSPEYIQPGVDQ